MAQFNYSALSFQKFESPKTQFGDKCYLSEKVIFVKTGHSIDPDKKLRNREFLYQPKGQINDKKLTSLYFKILFHSKFIGNLGQFVGVANF